jgi:hypothetical protein
MAMGVVSGNVVVLRVLTPNWWCAVCETAVEITFYFFRRMWLTALWCSHYLLVFCIHGCLYFLLFLGFLMVFLSWNLFHMSPVMQLFWPCCSWLLDDRAIEVLSPSEAKGFSSSLCVQASSGAHPAFCTMGTRGHFPRGKAQPGHDTDHSLPSSTEVVNE